ncbi:MAG: glycosyltransferase [Patescibacteria group bacterium]|nr:glycosyltransferase [Patescibacteria group bacterium]
MNNFLSLNPDGQSFGAYAKFGRQIYRRCTLNAKRLRGLKVIHVNSTGNGGGVAELLKNQIPLERDLGLKSRWLAIREPSRFFFVTKKIHNLLQGQRGFLSEPEKNYFLNRLRGPGQELGKYLSSQKGKAVVVLHDPQVLPLIEFLPASISVIVRLHIDLTTANKSALKFLRPFLDKAQRVIVSHPAYRPRWLNKSTTVVSYPAINPFSEKNRDLSQAVITKYFRRFGIDLARPVMAQVSRFDPWKDPTGVIEAYYLAKKQLPKLQLVLEGVMEAKDDPQALGVYRELSMEYQNDPDLFLRGSKTLTDRDYQRWVNALQRGADVVVQKSLREGFGLTVTEAQWKGRAVIGGAATGIRQQIKNGQNGFIVDSAAQCAKRVVQLVKKPRLEQKLGRLGRRAVKQKFLFNRLLLDYLEIYRALV